MPTSMFVHASTNPVLYVNPTSVPIGGTVFLTGSGFNSTEVPNCWAPMQFNPPGLALPAGTGTCTVDGSGFLSGSFIVGTGTNPQVYTASLPLQGVSATFVVYSVTTASTTTTTIISTILTATSTTTWVSVPSITASPSYALAGSSGTITVNGANFVGTYFVLDTGLVALAPPSGAISSGTFTVTFNVNPSAPVNSYMLVVHTNGGSADSASCPFVILPSITQTLTSYNTTVTRTSTSTATSMTTSTKTVPATVTSTVATVPGTSTVYTATTTGGILTYYPYTVTYIYGQTVTTVPTSTLTVYGNTVQTIYTGVLTVSDQYTVTELYATTESGGTLTTYVTRLATTTSTSTIPKTTTTGISTQSVTETFAETSTTWVPITITGLATITSTEVAPFGLDAAFSSPNTPFIIVGGLVGVGAFVMVLSRLGKLPFPKIGFRGRGRPPDQEVPPLDGLLTGLEPVGGVGGVDIARTNGGSTPTQTVPPPSVCTRCGVPFAAGVTTCGVCDRPIAAPPTAVADTDYEGEERLGELVNLKEETAPN